MLREDLRGICHRPCIYNNEGKCGMNYLFLMKQRNVIINRSFNRLQAINNSSMDKNIMLSNKELELLITGLHCVDKRNYNVYTTTYTPWSQAKELKENLRIKLKRVLLNV